jgi:hypothetical protein
MGWTHVSPTQVVGPGPTHTKNKNKNKDMFGRDRPNPFFDLRLAQSLSGRG